jgi:hypothetical protein
MTQGVDGITGGRPGAMENAEVAQSWWSLVVAHRGRGGGCTTAVMT